jgi:hypothetical protein
MLKLLRFGPFCRTFVSRGGGTRTHTVRILSAGLSISGVSPTFQIPCK